MSDNGEKREEQDLSGSEAWEMEAKGQELWGQQVKGQPHFCQPEEFCRLILDNGQAFAVS